MSILHRVGALLDSLVRPSCGTELSAILPAAPVALLFRSWRARRVRHHQLSHVLVPLTQLFPVEGNPYGDEHGVFGDNQFRYALLSLAACEAPLQLQIGGYRCGAPALLTAPACHCTEVL